MVVACFAFFLSVETVRGMGKPSGKGKPNNVTVSPVVVTIEDNLSGLSNDVPIGGSETYTDKNFPGGDGRTEVRINGNGNLIMDMGRFLPKRKPSDRRLIQNGATSGLICPVQSLAVPGVLNFLATDNLIINNGSCCENMRDMTLTDTGSATIAITGPPDPDLGEDVLWRFLVGTASSGNTNRVHVDRLTAHEWIIELADDPGDVLDRVAVTCQDTSRRGDPTLYILAQVPLPFRLEVFCPSCSLP